MKNTSDLSLVTPPWFGVVTTEYGRSLQSTFKYEGVRPVEFMQVGRGTMREQKSGHKNPSVRVRLSGRPDQGTKKR